MRLKYLISGSSAALILSSLVAGTAYAQETDEQVTTVDAIMVSPAKREQRLQDVPAVDNVAGEQLLQDSGVADIRELSILTPGLTVTATSNESSVTARIRGVGTVGDNPGLESSVGVVIDGVYRPRNGVGFGDLGDLQQVEVLKGPQGTLFGKNTSAGVINIFTNEPSFDRVFEGELTGGNYNAQGVSANMSGPVSGDSIAGSLYLAGRKRDGFMDVETLGGNRPSTDNTLGFFTARAQLLALPNDDLAVRIIADHTTRNESCCAAVQLSVGTQTANTSLPAGDPGRANARGVSINLVKPGSIDLTSTPFDRTAYLNRPNNQDIVDDGISAEITRNFGDLELTSISAARSWSLKTAQDTDFTAADLLYRPDDGTTFTEFTQFSQELRLAGENDRTHWLIGGFWAREELDTGLSLRYGSDFYAYFAQRVLSNVPNGIGLPSSTTFVPGTGTEDTHSQVDKTQALFFNVDHKVNDELTATVGLRYTHDAKSVVSNFSTTGGSCQAPALTSAGTLNALQGNPAFGVTQAQRTGAVQTLVGGLCVGAMNPAFDALGDLEQKSSDNDVSGTFKLAYRVNPDVMTYASYSRGYKSGGFNLDRETAITGVVAGTSTSAGAGIYTYAPDTDTFFAPETVDSFEVGAKTQWLDNHLSVNGAFFHQKFENFQLNTFIGTQFIVETLPEVTSTGVDLDILYLPPMRGLTLQGGATFANTKIGQFTAGELDDPGHFANLANLPGQRLGFAPFISATAAVTYDRPFGDDKTIRFHLSGKYTSDYNTGSDLHASKQQGAFTLFNARIALTTNDEKWTLELWGENILDTDYIQVGFNGPFPVASGAPAVSDPQSVYNAFLGAPRTFGLTLRTKR